MTRARDLAAFVSNADGDIKFDTDTLFIDSSTNRVGIGIDAPVGLPLQTKVSSGDNKLRMTTANKDSFILQLKDASGDVHLSTHTTADALVIKDDGNVGIGTTSPSEILSIEDAGNSPTVYVDGNSSPAFFEGRANRTSAGQHLTEFVGKWNNTRVARVVLTAGADTTNKDDGEIFFATAEAGTMAERWRITRDGHFKAAANGNGIDFSATEGSGATSSILSDYEEGSWTPTFDSGYSSISYTTQFGTYTKIGNTVRAFFRLDLSSATATSDVIRVNGLPYASLNNSHTYIVGTHYLNQGSAGGEHSKLLVFPDDVRIYFYSQDETGVSGIAGNTVGSSIDILGHVIYQAA